MIRVSKSHQAQQTRLLRDDLQGVAMRVTHRHPTAAEYLASLTDSYETVGDKVIHNPVKGGLAHLEPLIVSFAWPEPANAVEIEGEDGEYSPLSMTPGDPGYREDWYAVLEAVAAKLLVELTLRVYGPARSVREDPRPN